MGWSLTEPMARTDFASGACTAPKTGLLILDLGPNMWQGWVHSFFCHFSFLFFSVLQRHQINNTIFDFGWQFIFCGTR